jgi:hypothetical protein
MTRDDGYERSSTMSNVVSREIAGSIAARGTITVENKGEKPALIEFDFMPIHLKP